MQEVCLLKRDLKGGGNPITSLAKVIYWTMIYEFMKFFPTYDQNAMEAHFKYIKSGSSKNSGFFKENTMYRLVTKWNILLKNAIKDGSFNFNIL